MKRYMAVKGDSAVYLSRKEQVEKYLVSGCDIYVESDEGMRKIAGVNMELTEEIELGRIITGGLRNG